jgi:hypothetical protein
VVDALMIGVITGRMDVAFKFSVADCGEGEAGAAAKDQTDDQECDGAVHDR